MADAIISEGMGYAIENYLSWERIEDEELAKQWKIAGDAMAKITEILGDRLEEF